MFEEFAVDPELITEWEFFKELRDKFGIFQGRFIADYPHKGWKKVAAEMLEQRASGANPVRNHATIIEWLRSPGGSRDLRFARQQRPYHKSQPWIKNAAQQSDGFHAILSDKETKAPNAIRMQETTCLADEPLICVDTQPRVPRTDAELVEIAKPLLRLSKRLKWIDRFLASFDPERQKLSFKMQAVIECLDWMRATSQAPEFFELHLKWTSAEISKRLVVEIRRALEPHVPPATTMSVHWWAASEKENIHPRFLLTDVSGLHFDHGTDPGLGTTIVHYLQKQRWEAEWARYTPASTNLAYHGEAFLFPTLPRKASDTLFAGGRPPLPAAN